MSKFSHASYFCPLYDREIAEGKCLDINYERLGLLAAGCLEDVTALTGKREPEISATCRACPHLPFDEELGSVLFIKPPLPTDRTVVGPLFHSDERKRGELSEVTVRYDYKHDNGMVEWAQLIFSDVVAFDFRQSVPSRARLVAGSQLIRCLTDSEYLCEVLTPGKGEGDACKAGDRDVGAGHFRHFTVYFNAGRCINAIASSCRSETVAGKFKG